MSTIAAKSSHPAVPLVARLTVGSLFVLYGIRSVMYFSGSVGYFAKVGFSMPEAWVILAIIIQLGAGLAIIVGWKTRWAAWLLALFVLIAMSMAHRYWEVTDAAQYANQMQHFWKNVAIEGALLMLAAFGPGTMSVDKS